MSHSTHVGFNCPVTRSAASARVASVPWFGVAPGTHHVFDSRLPSHAEGVGQSRAAPVSVGFPPAYVALVLSASAAVGVGNHDPGSRELIDGDAWFAFAVGVCSILRSTALTITVNEVIVERGPPFIRRFIAMCASGVLPSSFATGVGHNEDSVAEVRGTNGGCRNALPFAVVPELGQVSENSSEAQGKVPWHVLQQRESWS